MTTVSSQSPLARLAAGYWTQSRQPLASLLFVAPLLGTYEAGVILMGPLAVRNGADAFLRHLLDWMGFGQYFLLPILTVCILLSWHYTTRQSWRVSSRVLYGMAVECILLALCLRLLLQVQGTLLQSVAEPIMQLPDTRGIARRVLAVIQTAVGFLGAGIYEELLFRLILLPLVAFALWSIGIPRRPGMLLAVLLTSLAFSAAHYVGSYGESIHWFSFLFRFLAGVFFAILFVYRGFGIATGAHAGYDILVGLL